MTPIYDLGTDSREQSVYPCATALMMAAIAVMATHPPLETQDNKVPCRFVLWRIPCTRFSLIPSF